MDLDVDDNLQLEAKIANLSGRIERHKAGEYVGYGSGTRALRTTSSNWLTSSNIEDYPQAWNAHRGTPYGLYWGHGTSPAPHRHRTLIIHKPGSQDITNGVVAHQDEGGTRWVKRHDRHMQLINTAVYDQKAQDRVNAMERTRKQRKMQQGHHEKTLVNDHLRDATVNKSPGRKNGTAAHYIIVNNIRFFVAEGGSKLIKTDDESNKLYTTPKRADVGGVIFHRSKRGNLYRAGLIKTLREQVAVAKSHKPCLHFSTNGSCPKGPTCRYIHDPEQVAMCKEYLQKGECRVGDYCDLSHNPTAERVPACLHFLRGSCTNPNCRYAHVRVNPGAPVCKAFAFYGFCPKGSICTQRHVHECPDYANKGFCRNDKCHMPHVDRAVQLRKAAAMNDDEDDGRSDISSDPEFDSDDVDSDEIDEELLLTDAIESHELSQQTDFVRL